MINTDNFSAKLAIDSKSIDDLRLQAKQNPDKALKEVAQQFEAIFIHMMLKSMRESLPKDGIFDSQQTQFYTQMLDQQLAQKMSSSGIGLADMMVRQLTQAATQSNTNLNHTELQDHQSVIISSGQTDSSSRILWPAKKTTHQALVQPEKPLSPSKEIFTEPLKPANPMLPTTQAEQFVNVVWPHAKLASEATGIPAHFMIAQAALESGWGKHEIRHADDNRPSFNLFGIKAGGSWKGAVVEAVTTEYINGAPEKVVEKFRAYNSYAEGFEDYANLLLNNPRYAAVLKKQDAAAFAHGLQKAGYATDPMYADKLIRIINSSSIKHSTI